MQIEQSKKLADAACEFFGGLSARHESGQRTVDAGEVIEHARALVNYIGQLERADDLAEAENAIALLKKAHGLTHFAIFHHGKRLSDG